MNQQQQQHQQQHQHQQPSAEPQSSSTVRPISPLLEPIKKQTAREIVEPENPVVPIACSIPGTN